MPDREQYTSGPASGAQARKDGENWTLILVRELRHPPEKVWEALTDPAHLREWAPFEADGALGTVGTRVKLTVVGAPTPQVSESTVKRALQARENKWREARREVPFMQDCDLDRSVTFCLQRSVPNRGCNSENTQHSNTPTLQHSNTPLLHYSARPDSRTRTRTRTRTK